ncbi:MAG TPA: EamA family transporter [Acidimicrobiia bacterium]|nr:EamA family transporter [Acidimicrobiia bacterium]
MDRQKSYGVGLPDRVTLAAFSAAVLIGGVNFVAVRYSNRELEPLFGAGVRFGAAALLFLVYMVMRRIHLPRGREFGVAAAYGVLAFTVSYAAAYWALQELSAGVAAVVFGATPLITILLAALHGLERISRRGLLGALIAVAGIAVLANPGSSSVPLLRLAAVLVASVAAAESSVIIKMTPPTNQVATNATAMGIGAALLLSLSAVAGEAWLIPRETATWVALPYLAALGSVGLFGLILFTLGRWTVSAVAYMTPLFPVVAMIAGAVIAGEEITVTGVIGGAIVIFAVYVGVVWKPRRRRMAEPRPAEN